MYASHVVSSWGQSSVTTFCGVVAQPSTYATPSEPKKHDLQLPFVITYDELNIFVSGCNLQTLN
jgi:hypothetical protein